MKGKFFIFVLVAMMAMAAILHGQELSPDNELYSSIKANALTPLFAALKTGNLKMLKEFLSDEDYKKREVLFEKNKAYGKFLSDYYKDAEFSVKSLRHSDKNIVADVEIKFPNGNTASLNLHVKSKNQKTGASASTRKWKIGLIH